MRWPHERCIRPFGPPFPAHMGSSELDSACRIERDLPDWLDRRLGPPRHDPLEPYNRHAIRRAAQANFDLP